MKIKEIRLENYKKFSNETFDLSREIILLYGENSSGKSSFLKSIAGAKQTFDQKNIYDAWAAQGEITDLGDYADFIYNHDTYLKLGIGITLETNQQDHLNSFLFIDGPHNEISFDLQYDHNKATESAKLYSIECKTTFINEQRKDIETFKAIRFKTQPTFNLQCPNSGATFLNDLSKRYNLFSHDITKQLESKLSINIKNAFDISIPSQQKQSGIRYTPTDFKTNIFKQQIELLNTAFKKIHYLGPLRMSPSRGYKKKLHELSVGTNGEQTPTILYYMQQAYERSSTKTRKETGHHQWERFEKWFELIFKDCKIRCEKSGSTIKVNLCKSGRIDSIQDIGFGYSQIIPIIAQAAVMAPGDTLIIEQPELHLHPKAQVEIAKFIVSARKYGINFIIETHSEHILKGLQLAISENKKRRNPQITNESLSIYYFSDNTERAYQELKLDEWGEIAGGWPKGFFNESLELSKKIFMNKNFP